MTGEIQMIHGLQSVFASPAGQAFSIFCARWAIFLFVPLVALTGIKGRFKSLRAAAYEAGESAVIALVLASSLAYLIGRSRPFLVSSDVTLLIPPPISHLAFPSGHSSASFAIAAALTYGHPLLGFVALGLAALVAFGRVAVGVHYPSDVVAGVFVGFISFGIAHLTRLSFAKPLPWWRKFFSH